MGTRRTNRLWILSTALLFASCALDTRPRRETPEESPSFPGDEPKSPPFTDEFPEGNVVVAVGQTVGPTESITVVTGPVTLADALATANQRICNEGLTLRHVTADEFLSWFADGKYFQWTKAERNLLEKGLASSQLPADWTLQLEHVAEELPWRLTLCGPAQSIPVGDAVIRQQSCAVIAEGERLRLYTESFRPVCRDASHDLCNDSFTGSLPSMQSVEFPSTVQVRVRPIAVAGDPAVPELAERDALEIQVLVTPETIPAIVEYFAVGYDPVALEARLRVLLDGMPSKWVPIQEFFFGWIRTRVNTFPQGDDNDVCHGPARQFYNETLFNGDHDRSTEATSLYLIDHYCVIGEDVTPRFGDYLYTPGAHSARFVLRDPSSHRDIVFSVQSGGISAYRFWWADEDMSGNPFAHEPLSNYRQKLVDVWRRCR